MSDPKPITNSADCFTGLEAAYDKHRPTYAGGAIDLLLADFTLPITAASIGCGTGIDCRQLGLRGVQVIGIDPNQSMLDAAKQNTTSEHGDVIFKQGKATNTGIDDHAVDLVVCAQSFHWFANEDALREFHRILKPRGRLALMWNHRDVEDSFTSKYEALAQQAMDLTCQRGQIMERARSGDPTMGGWFVHVFERQVPNPRVMTFDDVAGRLSSSSYFPRTEPLRTAMFNEARAIFEAHACDGVVTMREMTRLILAMSVG